MRAGTSRWFIGCFPALFPIMAFAENWAPAPCFPETYDMPPVARLEGKTLFADEMDEVGGWKVLKGGQNAQAALGISANDMKSGAGALAVNYKFEGQKSPEYVAIARPLQIEKPGCGMSVWAKVIGAPLPLRVRIADKTGESFQFALPTAASGDWQKTGVLFNESALHWGGDNNGKIDYPCRLEALVIDRKQKGWVGEGTVLFDRLEILEAPREKKPEAPAFTVEASPCRLGNIYDLGEEIALRAAFPNTGASAGADKLEWESADYWGKTVATARAVRGAAGQAAFRLPPPPTGFYRCMITLLAKEQPLARQEFRFAVLPPLEKGRKLQPSFFGVSVHFTGEGWPLEAMDLVARAGVSHIRDEMGWGRVEPKKGEFVFPPRYDQFADKAVSLGIEPLLIFDYANKFYDEANYPTSTEAIAGYARYAAEIARRYKGRVRYYEVWNEYTGGCGMQGKPKSVPEVYARMIEPTYKAVKAIDPAAVVVGIGGDNPREEKHCVAMDRMLKAGAVKFMDAASIHPYRYPEDPDSSELLGVLNKAAKLIADNGGRQRLWLTEIGWPTQLDLRGVTERVQAQMLVKSYVIAMASGCVDKMFWYDFKDDGLKRSYNENNFGIVHHQAFNCAPKPAYVAFATLTRLLTGAKHKRSLDLGQNARGYEFETPQGKSVTVLWAIDKPVRVSWNGAASVTDIMGGAHEANGGTELTPDPIYAADLKGPVRVEDLAPKNGARAS